MTAETIAILLPAFVAGLVVFATHVPLGQEVLRRGIVFIDLALAQIAALGALAVHTWMGDAASPILTHSMALALALVAAWCFSRTEKCYPQLQEGLIGAVFIVASSAALLMLSHDPHGGEATEAMLAGQILWVSWAQVAFAATVYAGVLAAWFLLPAQKWFYYLFAITVTLSVQLVGVYLVFASLILPALATTKINKRSGLIVGYVVSLAALVTGLITSALADLPTGPVLVCALAAIAWVGAQVGRENRHSRK